MNSTISHSTKQQKGFSLIELLISMVISMAVIAGAIELVITSKRSFLDQDEVSFIQTNARYALDLLSKDIRMAGYFGCASEGSVQMANSIDDDAGGFISLNGVSGFEGGTSTDSFPGDFKADAQVGSDAIIIRRADLSEEFDVKKHNPSSAVIRLWQNHSFETGSTLMIADASCRNIGLFQVSAAAVPSKKIVHNTGSVTNNCTKIIKGDFVCQASCTPTKCGGYGKATGKYGAGSKIMGFISRAYYIGDSTIIPGMPALKRRALLTSGAPATEEEELAVGVEDMEILYGVDTDDNGDVDQFRSADNMDVDSSGGIDADDWKTVVNVKISLVFRSQNPVLPKSEKRVLVGKEYNDQYMRQAINSTVKIRNRG